ncbi:DUF4235 domain-containing protein [Georgenia sp. Z1491]|uniref:DUF4235 domain-containing protein n=1 Tax=Georgenia sp. Z1491 TaxID=3416707 RepID=UPI003CF2360C
MDIGWKIVSTGAGVVAGIAANKILSKGWVAVTGHEPPEIVDGDDSVSLVEIVVFTAVSGAVVGLVRQLAMRQAAKWYKPAELQKVSDDVFDD